MNPVDLGCEHLASGGGHDKVAAVLRCVVGQHVVDTGDEVNILHIADRRNMPDLPVGIVEVGLFLETRGPEHARAVEDALGNAGFDVGPRAPSAPEPAVPASAA